MLKKQAALLLIAAAITLGGCFGSNENEDKGKGVELVRDGERVKILAEEEIVGGSFVIDKAIESDNILVEADKMKIVKVSNGKTYVSIVDVDAPSVEGDKIFEIKNCAQKVKVELSESINDGSFEKTMKKAFKTAEKRGSRAEATDSLLGDFVVNDTVDINDFFAFKANYGTALGTYDIAPATMGSGNYADIYSRSTPDGTVGLLDFLIFGRNYGKSINRPTVTGVTLTGATTVEAGSTIDIYAKVSYSNGETKSEVVEWSTSDETTATQTANGEWTRVTGVKSGTVTIKASLNGKVGELKVTVTPVGNKIDSIEVTGGNGVAIGGTLQLTATSTLPNGTTETSGALWTSSNAAVATVDSTGKVTGLTAGTTKIKAVRAGVSHEITVVVATVPNGVKVHVKGYKTIYAWEGSNTVLTGEWPGKSLETTEEAKGWGSYYFEGKDGINIIFIDAEGKKTDDLTGIKKGEHWYSEGKWYDYNPEEDFIAPEITATPEAGNQEPSSVEVVLTAKDNVDTTPKIYYTVDGTMPTTSSIQFSGKLTLTKDTVVKAITADSKSNVSKVYVLSYKLNQDATPPVIKATPSSGNYTTGQTVIITAKDNKDTDPAIYYTIDGTQPKAELSYMYNGQTINVSKSMVINVLAVDEAGNKANQSLRFVIGVVKEDWDFRDETIYFAMTTRFYDGDSGNNKCMKGDKASDPSWRGDLQGLTQKLDYIKALGFTAIWITPPVPNNSGYDYHGYHASSFYGVDSRIGGIEEYKKFIEAAHSKGIKIVQDVVFNHSGPTGLSYPGGHFDLKSTAYHNKGQINSWESYLCQVGDLAGDDCADLNTENEAVINMINDAYGQFIDMGVDAFRVDTAKHINRLIFNKYFCPALHKKGAENGKKFYMFGEVCTRVHDVWNKGVYSLSTPFYTWQERKEVSGSLEEQVKTLYDWENSQSNQPSSDNAFLKGNSYHEPDYSKSSGFNVIDFPMHWNFSDAPSAFNFASKTENDSTYNDSTWNVVYVDSHDYGPNSMCRYSGGTLAWAENMSLMFTFRGIPCIYYGSEVEFMKGATIDNGAPPLEVTGRAYYGDYLEGSVTATAAGKYTASGKVKETLESKLCQHLMRLNVIRKEIPALRKGQYSTADIDGGAPIKFKRRYTKGGVDSFALVTISGAATFKNLPAGTYTDVITGDSQTITEGGSIKATCSGQGNMRVYVLNGTGKIGEDGPFLK